MACDVTHKPKFHRNKWNRSADSLTNFLTKCIIDLSRLIQRTSMMYHRLHAWIFSMSKDCSTAKNLKLGNCCIFYDSHPIMLLWYVNFYLFPSNTTWNHCLIYLKAIGYMFRFAKNHHQAKLQLLNQVQISVCLHDWISAIFHCFNYILISL
jgi:hypothetical protein